MRAMAGRDVESEWAGASEHARHVTRASTGSPYRTVIGTLASVLSLRPATYLTS